MKQLKLFAILLLIAGLSDSCSVEKRLYRNGFYIARKGTETKTAQHPGLSISPQSISSKPAANDLFVPEKINVDSAAAKNTFPKTKEKKKEQLPTAVRKTGKVNGKTSYQPATIPPENSDGEKKNNIVALIAFILALLIGAGLLLGFLWPAIAGVALLIGLPVMIIGIVGFVLIKRHPNTYKNMWHALVGTWVGFAAALTAFIALMVQLYAHV